MFCRNVSNENTQKAQCDNPRGQLRSPVEWGLARSTTPIGGARSTTPTGGARSATLTGVVKFNWGGTRLIPKLFPGHVLGHATFWSTSFVSQSPGTIADQWSAKILTEQQQEARSAGKSFGISLVVPPEELSFALCAHW